MVEPLGKTCQRCGSPIAEGEKKGRISTGRKGYRESPYPDDKYTCPACGSVVDRPLGFRKLDSVTN